MSIQKKSLIGGLIGVIVAFALIAGGTIYYTGSFFGIGAGSGTLQVSMIDPPQLPQGVDITHVYINYTAIEVHVANGGNQSGWKPVTASGTNLDLMGLVANSALLGSTTLPAGTYNIVRFNVTSAIVTVYNSTSGTSQNYAARVTSGMVQSVLVGVSVKSGQTSALLIDITPRVTGSVLAGFTLVPSATAAPTAPVSIPAAGAAGSQNSGSRTTP